MALGFATLYGDMCGGLGVLSDVSKTKVYSLARWINREREIIPNARGRLFVWASRFCPGMIDRMMAKYVK